MRKLVIMCAAAAAVFVAGCATKEPPPPPPKPAAENTWTARLADLKRALEAATQGTGVIIEQTADNRLRVVMPNDLSFDVGRSNVKRDLAQVLDKIAEGVRGASAVSLQVIGHTDSTGGDAANDKLSLSRANSARDHLAARGVAADIISTDGKGEREPLADNTTAAGRAQNRRVEIFVAEKG